MTEPSPRPARSLFRGWRRWVAFGLGAVLLYALIGFFLVPWVMRSQIEKRARANLHREASVRKVRFNPFTLVTTIEGFALKDRDGGELVSFELLRVNLDTLGIFRRAWLFKEIRIERLFVVGRVLANRKLSIADLFEKAPDAQKEPDKPYRPHRVIVRLLQIVDSRARFVDESRSPPFESIFEPLNLEVHDLITIPEEGGDHAITLGLEGGATIRWTGKQTVDPLLLEGTIQIEDMRLPRVWEYAGRDQPFDVREGMLNVALDYDIHREEVGGVVAVVSNGSMQATGVKVRPRGGAEDWLTVPRAEVRELRATWPAQSAEVGGVRIVEPEAVAWLGEDGRLNWQALFEDARAAAPAGPQAAEPPTPPVSEPASDPATQSGAGARKLNVAQIEIEKGSVRFEDRTAAPPVLVAVTEATLRVDGASSKLDTPVRVKSSARLNESGTFTLEGTVTPHPTAADLDLSLAGLDLVPFQPYLSRALTLQIASAVAGLKGKARFAGDVASLEFDGEASLDRLDLHEGGGGGRIAAWDRLTAAGIHVSGLPGRARVRQVELDRAFAKIRIDKSQKLNIAQLAAAPWSAVTPPSRELPRPAPAPSPAPGQAVEVGKIVIRGASIDFADDSLVIPFHAQIHDAKGTITDLSTVGKAAATLALQGLVDEKGSLRSEGTLRPFDPFAATDVRLIFRDLEMGRLTPYSSEFAGYAIDSGVLDLDLRYIIQNRQLIGDHEVVATNLVLGEKVEGSEAGLPVRLAIALLKDKDGRIDLRVPIEGTVDDPQFAYRKIFWQAVKKILVNIAAAPFRAIGRLFGKDEEDLELVDFNPGQSALVPAETEKLTKLADEIGRRPELSLEIEGRYDPVIDADAIRNARLEALIASRRDAAAVAAEEEGGAALEMILETLYTEQFSAEALETERQKHVITAPEPTPAESGKKPRRKKEPAAKPGAPPRVAPGQLDEAGFYDALRAQLLAAQPVGESDFAALANERAAAIVSGLTASGALDASRVTIVDPAPAKKKKSGSQRIASEMTMTAREPRSGEAASESPKDSPGEP